MGREQPRVWLHRAEKSAARVGGVSAGCVVVTLAHTSLLSRYLSSVDMETLGGTAIGMGMVGR